MTQERDKFENVLLIALERGGGMDGFPKVNCTNLKPITLERALKMVLEPAIDMCNQEASTSLTA